jgi:hypothetical protein
MTSAEKEKRKFNKNFFIFCTVRIFSLATCWWNLMIDELFPRSKFKMCFKIKITFLDKGYFFRVNL